MLGLWILWDLLFSSVFLWSPRSNHAGWIR